MLSSSLNDWLDVLESEESVVEEGLVKQEGREEHPDFTQVSRVQMTPRKYLTTRIIYTRK